MVNQSEQIIVISNDVVPGLGVPVAAPGLRAFGLAEGLRANGYEVKTLVVKSSMDKQWKSLGRNVPRPTAPHTEIVGSHQLGSYVESHAPATVILINSNQVDHLRPVEGIRYVLDFFAPKMLEMLYHKGEEYPEAALQDLRRRKLRAIEMADAFIVNGEKKVPYFLGWLLQGGKDVRHLPLEVVNMGVPLLPNEDFDDLSGAQGEVRFLVAGYLQAWSQPGSWIRALENQLDRPGVGLDLLLPEHWGSKSRHANGNDHLEWLKSHPAVSIHTPMIFSRFQSFLSGADVSIDLFEHNLEREYAMVTRSIVALASGVPVIHPPFTEVSPMISEYDAGWTVEPHDTEKINAILDSIVREPELVKEKSSNARKLAARLIEPANAVKPLVRILESS